MQAQTTSQLPIPAHLPKVAVEPLTEAAAVGVLAGGNLSKPNQAPTMAGGGKPCHTGLVPAYSGWGGEVYLGLGEFSVHLSKHLTPHAIRQNQLLPYFKEARSLRWLARGALLERGVNTPFSL